VLLQKLLEIVLLGAAAWLLVVWVRRLRSREAITISLLVWSVAWVTAFSIDLGYAQRLRRLAYIRSDRQHRPLEAPSGGYVGSQSCRKCHPGNYHSWHASYHRTMTQIATPETVIGNFDNVTLELHDHTYRLFRRGDEFWVDMDDLDRRDSDQRDSDRSDGSVSDTSRVQRRIVQLTGSHHMQGYWYELNWDRYLGMLPFMYLEAERRWIPRHAAFLQPETDKISTERGRWNKHCLVCHATNAKPGLVPKLGSIVEGESYSIAAVNTTVSELGIACEACHGPGEQHVRANQTPGRRYQLHLAEARDDTIINPARVSARLSSQTCGQCHGIHLAGSFDDHVHHYQHGHRFRPGSDFDKSGRVTVRPNQYPWPPVVEREVEHTPDYLESSFWTDGMVRVSGREYNGLIDTPCFQHDVESHKCPA